MRPFRFGVSIWSAGSRAEWVKKARQAEDLGYATLTVPDHLADVFAPLPALVSVAEATRRLRVGPLVLNNDFRHPVLLAREAATIDLLTDGRLELGLGAGHLASEYLEAGLRFDRSGTRIERLAEAATILSGLLEGREVTFEGEHYQVRGHQVSPRPVQRPRPPLLIGGNGRRLLSLAAREADIVGLTGLQHRRGGADVDVSAFKAEAVDTRIQWIRDAAGDRVGHLEFNALVQVVIITDDRRQAAAQVAERIGHQLSPEEVLQSPYVLIGTVEQLVEDLQARRELWGFSYYVIFEPATDAFAPVVARLTGT